MVSGRAAATLISRLAQVVRTQPGRPALLWGREMWSYRDFWARAELVARGLLERGVGPGSAESRQLAPA